jgi:Na+/melibiose symporter-like transporter
MLYYLLVVLLAPRAARPCEHHRVALAFVVGGALLSGGAVLVASQWSGFWPVAAAIALAGIGQALLRAPVVALTLAIGECAPSRPGAGVMLGALRTFERVGSILGLLLAAWLAARFGYAGAAAATGHLVVAGAVVFAVFRLWMALRSREGLR